LCWEWEFVVCLPVNKLAEKKLAEEEEEEELL
jgi:hypothetical protein